MPSKAALFAYTIIPLLFTLIAPVKPDPTLLSVDCHNTTVTTTSTYTPNSTYQTNLNTLFSVLSSNSNNASNGFYNSTSGRRGLPDAVYGLFLCRGDVGADACRDCVVYATGDVVEKCPGSKRVTIWYDECLLRYSNESIFAATDTSFWVVLTNKVNVTNNGARFSEFLGEVMNNISNRASSGGSSKKFAIGEASYSPLQPVYGLAQCIPNLSDSDCGNCLRVGISKLPDAKQGATVLSPSCFIRYEMFLFYNASFSGATPPPSSLLPPPSTTAPSSPGKGGTSPHVIIAIVVPIGVIALLFLASFFFISKKAKRKYNSLRERNVQLGDDTWTLQSLQYDLGTIRAATNNFSDDNKIGEGGFGQIFKGLLLDGQEVAVKRLSRTSGQGALEFKNEMLLVAKLQHRNLVRLFGFCLDGGERILIYEFVPNKSLDYFLFDPQEQVKLDWSGRFKIIRGIARGLLYLHEDSRLTIIHRDLKASNILLDGDMNAKISDFGMARIFGVDQTQGSTTQIAGTSGYMAPEYAMHGQFSTKSDVFSFGVLVLEIISGKKNNNFYQSDGALDLLSYSWKLWRGGTPLDLMDPTLEGPFPRNEVTRCIHIALLCVQSDPNARPSMAKVVLMLNSYSSMVSLPQEPGFIGRKRIGSNIFKGLDSDTSTSKSTHYSANEASITELDPR